MDREEEIRLIAYYIWEKDGGVHGRDIEHWLKAEAVWETRQKKMVVAMNNKAESKKVFKRNKR